MGVFSGPADWWTDGTNEGRTHIATKGVIQDGIVLNLDAGASTSYPGSGTSWSDLSGNSNTGTLVNGVGYDSGNGGALSFDGVNDYVSISSGASSINSLNISVGCWVFQNNIHTSSSFDDIKSLVQIGISEIGNNSCFYLHLRESKVYFRYQKGQNLAQLSPGIIQEANTWHYYTGVSNNSSILLYKDGVLVGSTPYTISFSSLVNTNVDIGKTGGYTNYINGNIAQVSIYNRALTASEVQQNFNALRGRFGL